MSDSIRHRSAGGSFKSAGALTPDQISAFQLSVSDAELQAVLDRVGGQLLALEPAAADKQRVGYSIAGRNPYAVRFSCWDCQFYWHGERAFQLVLVPDTAPDTVLPPEFVRMVDPLPLLSFEVVAWV